jgi:hypothetical protein
VRLSQKFFPYTFKQLHRTKTIKKPKKLGTLLISKIIFLSSFIRDATESGIFWHFPKLSMPKLIQQQLARI